MVQILEDNSFMAQLGKALRGGVEKGGDFAQQMMMEDFKNKQRGNLVSRIEQEPQQGAGNKLQGVESNQSNTENQPNKSADLLRKAKQYEAFGEHGLASVATEEAKMSQRETAEARKETLPIRKQYVDKAAYARKGIENKKQMIKLLERGDVNDPLVVQASQLLPGALGNKLLSADTQLYQAGLFDEFGVLKNMFPGQIRVKEIELLEDKLSTLDKSHEAKAKILDNGVKKLEADIILAKAARKVEKENPNARALEFDELVYEKAKPELDKLYQEIIDNYDKIYYEFAPEKSSYIDQEGNRYKNVPKSELKDLFDSAKQQGIELRVLK